MKQVILGFRTVQTPKQIHKLLAETFSFPPYYGANLDALWDCLSELPIAEKCVEVLLPEKNSAYLPYLNKVLSTLLEAYETFSVPSLQNIRELKDFLSVLP